MGRFMALAIATPVPVAIPQKTQSLTFGVKTANITDSASPFHIPVNVSGYTPVAVLRATSTTSPKTITFATPTNVEIAVGSTISGGSFAGTETVSAVTRNTANLITSVTYTGTGAINASAVPLTFTAAGAIDTDAFYIRVTLTAKGGSIEVQAVVFDSATDTPSNAAVKSISVPQFLASVGATGPA